MNLAFSLRSDEASDDGESLYETTTDHSERDVNVSDQEYDRMVPHDSADCEEDVGRLVLPSEAYRTYRRRSVHAREGSLESLSIVTVLLAGFAIQAAIEFDPKDWHSTELMYIYGFCQGCVVAECTFVSLVAVMTIVGCKRIESWDEMFHFRGLSAEKVYNNKNYIFMMEWLYGGDRSKWTECPSVYNGHNPKETLPENENIRVLHLPLTYAFFKIQADGPYSPVGVGMLLFPPCCLFYFVATLLDITKKSTDTFMISMLLVIMLPVGLFGTYHIRKLSRLMTA
jgi:hypothetical protein